MEDMIRSSRWSQIFRIRLADRFSIISMSYTNYFSAIFISKLLLVKQHAFFNLKLDSRIFSFSSRIKETKTKIIFSWP